MFRQDVCCTDGAEDEEEENALENPELPLENDNAEETKVCEVPRYSIRNIFLSSCRRRYAKRQNHRNTFLINPRSLFSFTTSSGRLLKRHKPILRILGDRL